MSNSNTAVQFAKESEGELQALITSLLAPKEGDAPKTATSKKSTITAYYFRNEMGLGEVKVNVPNTSAQEEAPFMDILEKLLDKAKGVEGARVEIHRAKVRKFERIRTGEKDASGKAIFGPGELSRPEIVFYIGSDVYSITCAHWAKDDSARFAAPCAKVLDSGLPYKVIA
jgi:hypothetical protein